VIQIAEVGIHDLIKLQIISRSTFAQTFEEYNNPEDMQAYLNSSFSIEKLTEE